ncbi:hypothetical protein JOB18_010564 [Solea senegalensis]|uniref:Uncharacterized protein n=1 Tax=Solea senegalensis TaxID=28829 RepID=A0AAV6QN62_SOLSE|nr:hypothetical protein JOB18_010564 [Solea senegalensis]
MLLKIKMASPPLLLISALSQNCREERRLSPRCPHPASAGDSKVPRRFEAKRVEVSPFEVQSISGHCHSSGAEKKENLLSPHVTLHLGEYNLDLHLYIFLYLYMQSFM